MSTKAITTLSAAVLIACVSATSVQAKENPSFKAVSDSCDSVTWSEEALATYPTIASACQGVEERNGKRYVEFRGTVKSNQNKGQKLVVNFKDGGEVTLTPSADMSLYVGGKKTPIASLGRGDELHFYVPEDRFVAQFPEVETQSARFVIVPILVHDSSQQQLASLPHTAGPLPLLALMGAFSLGLGGLLSLYRRRR
jgi:hypothetical protein